MSSGIFRRSKLSWKLAIIYAVVFSLLLLLLNASVLYGVRLFLVSQATQEINAISSTIADKIIGTPSEQTPLNDPEIVSDVGANAAVSIRVAGPDGKVVNGSGSYRDNGPAITDSISIVRQINFNDANIILKNSGITDHGETVAYLQVLINMEREYSFLRILLFLMIAANVAGIALSLLAGYYTSKRMLSPIGRIMKAVQEIDIDDLNMHVEEGKADDELSRLAKTFNNMLDRLRQSFERQSRFVSDASHELRTPIAVIRGYAGLIGKWGSQNNVIMEESVTAITNETIEMTELIEKLLLIAKSDSRDLNLNPTAFRLSDLVEEVAGEFRIVSPDHTIICSCGEPVDICADRLMIKQALRALVENSVKYTPSHGRIDLGYTFADGSVAITVKDSGIGIPSDEIDRIFDRFYRVDKSRSKETGGTGLGLSIVQQIIKAHDGTIEPFSKPGEGTTISIILPFVRT